MIFLTIGTLESFDRLVQTVDELVGAGLIQQDVFAQTGRCHYRPKHIKTVEILDKCEFDCAMERCDFVISHAGMGSIITAITLQKPMIVMPRLKKYHEHVNDHQLDTARRFEMLGIVLAANDSNELIEKIALMPDFKPAVRKESITLLKSKLSGFLSHLCES